MNATGREEEVKVQRNSPVSPVTETERSSLPKRVRGYLDDLDDGRRPRD